jgi:hypothetical protein
MLENLTLNELLSNIGYLCEANSAIHVLKYERSASLNLNTITSLIPVYMKYRDELVRRISNSETVLERSSLTQMYYRLLAVIRNMKNYTTYLDDFKELAKLNSNINLELNTSYSQIENVSLADTQLDYNED